MNRQEAIKKLYFECKYNQKEIAETLEISNKYVSKVLLEDSRYKEEKEKKSKSPDSADYLYICCIIFGIDRLYCTFCCGR